MATYTQETILAFNDSKVSRALIVDGSASVSAWNGVSWIATDSLVTGTYQYYTSGLKLRFEPAADSSITIQED